MREENTEQLWGEFTAGKEAAFARLYQLFYPQLYRYGRRLVENEETVRDVLQDTFYYLYQKRHALTNEVDNVRAYLLLTFRRRLLRRVSANNRLREQHQQHAKAEDRFVIGAEDIIITAESSTERRRIIADALNDLPARQREILYLKYYQEQSTKEIAATLSITYQTVANHLTRALKKLRSSDHLRGLIKAALVLIGDQLG